jgi:hypothetical protein
MHEVLQLLEEGAPDVLMLDVPEHAPAWRAAQEFTGKRFPIISTVTHAVTDPSLLIRQMDGGRVSDILAFPLPGIENAWLRRFSPDDASFTLVPHHKRLTWNAVFDPSEVDRELSGKVWLHHDRPTINFISRLSDNERTHYKEFFAAVRELERLNVDCDVWVANPNDAMNPTDVRNQSKLITRVGYTNRKQYLQSLWQSDVVPILYRDDLTLSIGLMEAVAADNTIVSPYRDDDMPIYPAEPDRVEQLAASLHAALCSSRVSARDWLLKNRGVEQNISTMKRAIKSVTTKKEND